MRSKFVLALVGALFVGLMSLPASANTNEAGVFTGLADVGKTFLSADDCDKSGQATVVGRGLYVVGSANDLTRERQGAWHLETVTSTGTVLEACGWLGPLDGTVVVKDPEPFGDRTNGVGPACGASKGHNGMGEMRNAAGTPLRKLFDLGWKNAVGGLLPVTGHYQEYSPSGSNTKGKKGTVAAQVVAQGGQRCLDPDGAQQFEVVGAYELVNVNTSQFQAPKIQRKQCKETDPDDDKLKDQGDPSDPDWKRPCPTGRKGADV